MTQHGRRPPFNAAGAVSVLAGAALFAIVLWRADPQKVWQGIADVGWWFAGIVTIAGVRFATRAAAWSRCVEPPHHLPLSTAFAGVVAGDTIGNLTPLGPVLGEPAKIAYVRHSVAAGPALTALTVETLLYTFSAAGMIAAGTLALLFTFDAPPEIQRIGAASVAAVFVLFVVAMIMLWRRPALLSWIPAIAREGTTLFSKADKIRAVEQDVYTFAARRPGAILAVAVCEGLFHTLGVVEAYFTLFAITGQAPTILTAFVLETAHRLMTVLFKVVPFQMGVGELGTAAVTNVLGLGGTVGVTVSVVRKARMAAWALLGAWLLARRGLGLRPFLRGIQGSPRLNDEPK